MPNTNDDGFFTTLQYVDCECETDYIHPNPGDPDAVICERCGVYSHDGPDSRVSEVVAAGLPVDENSYEWHNA